MGPHCSADPQPWSAQSRFFRAFLACIFELIFSTFCVLGLRWGAQNQPKIVKNLSRDPFFWRASLYLQFLTDF